MKQDRIIRHLDKMARSGQMTDAEAKRIRAAQGTPDFDEVVLPVRVRHASERLDAAVGDGEMSRTEADGHLQSLQQGEHPKGLRARLRDHRRPEHGADLPEQRPR